MNMLDLLKISSLVSSALLFTACEYDVDAPVVHAVTPEVNTNINNKFTPLVFSASDKRLGISPDSLKISINGIDATEIGKIRRGVLVVQPTEEKPLPEGNFTVSITLADLIVNQATTDFSYTGEYESAALQVSATVTPLENSNPSTAQYSVKSENASDIALYEWDFNGDGNYDHSDIATGDITYAYTKSDVALKVTDILGKTTTYKILTPK